MEAVSHSGNSATDLKQHSSPHNSTHPVGINSAYLQTETNKKIIAQVIKQ